MHTTLPADPYEKQLVKLEQTIKATGFAHIMSQTQFAHRAHQDARQSHSDALNTQLSIICNSLL
jgi:hypothetical protein